MFTEQVSLLKKGTNAPQFIKSYEQGDSFGELALLYNAPRAATVKCKKDSLLWVLDRETFNYIVKDASSKKRDRYEQFLKSVDILSELDSYEVMQIADALKTCHFDKGGIVMKEGEYGDVFYIIEEGSASAYKKVEAGKPAEKVKDYKKGDFFGELALLKGQPRAATIKAESDLRLVTLDRRSFKRLLGPIEKILEREQEKFVKYMKN